MKNHPVLQSKRQLASATQILQKILTKNPPLKREVTAALKKAKYSLKDGERVRNVHLLAFLGATGGYGIVLVAEKHGPEMAVSTPDRRGEGESFASSQYFSGYIWKGATLLPKLVRQTLVRLQTSAGIRKMLDSGLKEC